MEQALHDLLGEKHRSADVGPTTSGELLPSGNEAPEAVCGKPQRKTPQHGRAAPADPGNVFHGTELAILLLDADLRIQFFTPATRSIFSVRLEDMGRPLTDLHSRATDHALPSDLLKVRLGSAPVERDVETAAGMWFCRRITPRRHRDGLCAGLLIVYSDLTGRRRAELALEATSRRFEQASCAKSKAIATASHDLRQPLQTLALLYGLLADLANGDGERRILARALKALDAMTAMLDALLDVDRIEAGAGYFKKPVGRSDLLAAVDQALKPGCNAGALAPERGVAPGAMAALTPRQRQVMEFVVAGRPSKNIAADLGISRRTVENHRASIMKRTGSSSLPDLVRLALASPCPDEGACAEPGGVRRRAGAVRSKVGASPRTGCATIGSERIGPSGPAA